MKTFEKRTGKDERTGRASGIRWRPWRNNLAAPNAVRATAGAVVLLIGLSAAEARAEAPVSQNRNLLNAIPTAKFSFGGPLGQRVKADVENWLLVTPAKNPGLLDVFVNRESNVERDVRDNPKYLVPWAGEFVGKYLTSAVLAMRMSDDPRLRETVAKVIDRLAELQADDGYLGCWPKKERLMGHWDLWGHYHVMLGLILWSEQTGDRRAMAMACKAADLVCNTFLDTSHRVFDAGSCEMNMAILHGMAILYHKTGNPRFLRMAKEVLKDFERAGDYYRLGLKGEEFYRTPKPRWESLHALQGMAELWRVTGDETFRRAFSHHWASMRRFDLRNTGGFSSGEQATGNPFVADQAIETCCVIAWMAVMVDALQLTGDATIADDLELATFNAIAGAQHPSGEWCTYNTPINGTRVPSHVAIDFQARPNAKYLNCCSVNGPRGLGMLSQWGIMRNAAGLIINYYGAMRAEVTLADGTPVVIEEETSYPVGDKVQIKITPRKGDSPIFAATNGVDAATSGTPRKSGQSPAAKQFTLALRIPAWSTKTEVLINGQPASQVRRGDYLKLTRTWQAGDEITLRLDMGLRYESGDLEQAGNVSLYRGPILLCSDERFQAGKPSRVDVTKLPHARVVPTDAATTKAAGPYSPWLMVDLPAADGKSARLIDFASAGATGKSYQSWLPATAIRPPKSVAWLPADGAKVGPGAIGFAWRAPASSDPDRRHSIIIAETPDFERPIITYGDKAGGRLIVPATEAQKLPPGKVYYWKVVARNAHGESESIAPHKRFTIDPSAPSTAMQFPRPDGVLVAASLRGTVNPEHGLLIEARGWQPAAGVNGQPNQAIELNGKDGLLKYSLMEFPSKEFTAAVWVAVTKPPTSGVGHVFSAWCRGMDDPLRIVVADNKFIARVEAGQFYASQGVPMEPGRWRHVAAVKRDDKVTLYVDGQPRGSVAVPGSFSTTASNFALGGNPNLPGISEYLAARFANLRFYARALSETELRQLHESQQPK
jgi:uncharacterized protein